MVNYGSVAFDEQIEFYKRKIPTPTQSWADIYGAEHDYAAVVAGAHKREIIEDFATAIQDFIAKGKTLEEFRQSFDEIVAKHNWAYNGGRNWRTRIIYETNLRSSYQAGRYAQLNEMRETMPWWEYVHSDAVARPRPEHQSWDGLILHHSDPWWKTHFPINAWGCQCTVIGRSQAYLDRLGLKPDTAPEIEWQEKIVGVRSGNPRIVRVPKGIDPSFEHIPGASRLEGQVMPPLDENGEPKRVSVFPQKTQLQAHMPSPRKVSVNRLLPLEREDNFYVKAFLDEFGATPSQPVIFEDVMGEPLVISKSLFISRSGHSKVKKRGREKYMLLLAEALKHPDEIWVQAEYYHEIKHLTVRRRYISQIEIEQDGEIVPTLAVFEVGKDGWLGITDFVAEKAEYIKQVRSGILLYRREDNE
ncbi:PBECR2 nuclease fold domain-containing protein [Glaesserella sp.]|uniref:PBECR2 nuclease fold domain-containing protein n=1 Tax=Glaesserella sp. TaxID=2094731 RepID=UPI0035A1A026